MSEESGLIDAFLLDGHGNGEAMAWPEIRTWQADQGLAWIHLDFTDPDAQS
jgi:zinc transporter